MTFDEYQAEARRTSGIVGSESRVMAVMGLAGETGEVVDYLKKVWFHDHPYDDRKLTLELGDVLWYLAMLADAYGINLSMVAQANIDKLTERYPDGFDPERSKARTEI